MTAPIILLFCDLSFLIPRVAQSSNLVGDAGAFGLGEGLKLNSSVQQLNLVSCAPFILAVFDRLFFMTPAVQLSNRITIAGTCRITACILRNHKLVFVQLPHSPSDCVRHVAWRREGLPVPPTRVLDKSSWWAVLHYLRQKVCSISAQQHKCLRQPHA
jgi:hypothetical protein